MLPGLLRVSGNNICTPFGGNCLSVSESLLVSLELLDGVVELDELDDEECWGEVLFSGLEGGECSLWDDEDVNDLAGLPQLMLFDI